MKLSRAVREALELMAQGNDLHHYPSVYGWRIFHTPEEGACPQIHLVRHQSAVWLSQRNFVELVVPGGLIPRYRITAAGRAVLEVTP